MLDSIRKLKLKMIRLQQRIESVTYGVGAIRYDKDRVQSSPRGDALEQQVLNKIQWEEDLKKCKDKYDEMVRTVKLDGFTDRQKDFIRAYYFQALTQTECVAVLGIKISAVCRLRKRVLKKFRNA